MSVYTKVLKLLLEESESQKIGVPEESMIKTGLKLRNKEGFEYTVEKVGKDKSGKSKYLIASDGYKEVVTYEQIKNNYERAFRS